MFFSLISNSATGRMLYLENMTFYLQRAFHAFKTNPHLIISFTIATNCAVGRTDVTSTPI